MKKFVLLILTCLFLFSSCGVSNKRIIRMQKLEEGVGNPSTIEEYKEAIEKYDARIADLQLSESQVGIWYKILGTRYLDKKMYGQALEAFQSALQYYPDNQNLYYYVGICAGYMSHTALDYNATGSMEKKYNYLKLAETAYLRAIEIEPRYSRALYALSVLYVYELDEPAKAIPYLQKVLDIEKKHTDAMFVLARAYYSSLEFDIHSAHKLNHFLRHNLKNNVLNFLLDRLN